MHPFVEYELRVAISLLFFWLFFHFVLRKQPFHHFNRIIILVSSFLCVFSPLIPIRFNREISYLPNQLFEEIPVQDHGFVFWCPLVIILIGSSVVFISKLLSWRAMARFFRHGSHIPLKGKNRLVEIDSSYFSPFVWFNTIFVSKTEAWPEEPVLMHELEHIRLRHTWDVLYTDILVIFQWFNPAVWLIQRDLKDIHEYEADAGVLSMGYDMRKYGRIVLKLSAKAFGYVDNLQFASGSVRRRNFGISSYYRECYLLFLELFVSRIIMSQVSPSWSRFAFILILPSSQVLLRILTYLWNLSEWTDLREKCLN